mgnify:FL=1
MNKFRSYILFLGFLVLLTFSKSAKSFSFFSDTTISDSTLTYTFNPDQYGGLFMNFPENFTSDVFYDENTGNYILIQRVGNTDLFTQKVMTFQEYLDYQLSEMMNNHWDLRSGNRNSTVQQSYGLPKLYIPGEAFDKVFGGNTVDIRPQGSAELIFSLRVNRLDNPNYTVKQRKTTSFDFQEKIQMNVIGKIGEKLKLTTNFNTEATFNFENDMKLEYTGFEDEIIKKIEIGNVSLPLNGTLITGSQSLFGLKTQLQFGRTTITGILSQQKSTTSEIEVTGGAQTTEFDIYADQYEANKHFFLSHYFKENYNTALANLPYVNSPINITKVEVWITNKTGETTDSRNIISFLDLGETDGNIQNTLFTTSLPGSYPDNDQANDMYQHLLSQFSGIRDINQVNNQLSIPSNLSINFIGGQDYEKLERSKKLKETEYTIHPQLGYISLNQSLNNDEVLAVAFQYTIGNEVFQVGELTSNGPSAPDALIVKLLKGTTFSPSLMNWELMMKNIYALGAYQMSSNEFVLDILYENTEESGGLTNYIPEGSVNGTPIIKLLNLDNLNQQQASVSDGVFDFIEGLTARSSNGRIIFPVLEPFGSNLRENFSNQQIADKYVYDYLYDSTLTVAQKYPELNKFRLKGSYKSSSGSEISLNAMNVPEGSVTVTAGSQKLVENQHYTVDYMLGRVTIIDEGILNSGIPIKIKLENNAMFGIQDKTLIGFHADYEINRDFIIGGTLLKLSEAPYVNKINAGDEPISNTIIGLDGTYQSESPFITKMVDMIPFIETKAKSRIIASGEIATLIPGHHRRIDNGEGGTSYIDDFEASRSSIDIKNALSWHLASIPQGQNDVFENASLNDDLTLGFKRAKLAWYTIDPTVFFRSSNITPPGVDNNIQLPNGGQVNQQSYHYTREILEKEVFPNKDPQYGTQITNMSILDLAYYPSERGPYNYTVNGLNADGTLMNPQNNWAGIMRKIETNDFEAANIEFVEFWMMDPFNIEDGDITHSGGDLYIQLGNVSEDVLKDGYKSFENGLPINSTIEDVDTTSWGRVPTSYSIVEAFDNDPLSREYQDVGLDGLSDNDELLFFDSVYIQEIANNPALGTSSGAYQNAINDPSGDNFHYFRGTDFDNAETPLLQRYKNFNNVDGNSATIEQSIESYATSASSLPNTEDINRDNTLGESESYFQYKVSISPQTMNISNPYISDVLETTITTKNGEDRLIKWYQFRVPVYNPEKVIGAIQDFKSIRFIRMVLSDFSEPIICRFSTLELVRGEWRRYNLELSEGGEYIPNDIDDETLFDVSSVNIEENGHRNPINYVLPPGIEQNIDNTTTSLRRDNEQSLVLKVCNLADGDARAAYKTSDLDVRAYKRLKMFVHAEGAEDNLQDGELSCFIRLGTDFTSNYYEYEIPLKVTNFGQNGRTEVWPVENNMDILFEDFQEAKQERNFTTNDVSSPFIRYLSGGKKIIVVGNPNLSRVKTIMIGVRNPKKTSLDSEDDGLPKCGEIWVNELRLCDFDEYGGWAANARFTTRLADFGTVNIAGNMSTIGFGSIEKKVNERQKSNDYQYDLSSNLELGKFFPEKYGVKIPMHISSSQQISNPQYNPLDPDILFKTTLETMGSKSEKDSLKHISQDFVSRNSINFTNVRKLSTQNKGEGGKSKTPKIYDLENFTLSYSKNEIFIRNINTEKNRTNTYRGAFTYNFNTRPKNIKPFSKLKIGKGPYAKLIKDINFYTMPKSFSFRTDLDRMYNETLLRNVNNSYMLIAPTYNKYFNWNKSYEVKYDLTRTLKIDFSSRSISSVDEPEGRMDRDYVFFKENRDTVWQNFWRGGRPTSYHHDVSVNYQLPLNKIPLTNFLSLNTRYSANYDWTAAPLSLSDLGNNIQNSNNIQYNGQINLTTLYNKVPYFKKILSSGKKKQRGRTSRTNQENEKEEEEKKKDQYKALRYAAKFVFGVKNISVNLTQNEGTFIPGFMPEAHFFGQHWGEVAPGIPFVLGSQRDIRYIAGQNGWITQNENINTLFKRNSSSNLVLRSTVEPFNKFRIELTANKTQSLSEQEYYRWSDADNMFTSFSPTQSGNFSISFISWGTAFSGDNDNSESQTFQQFRNYRNEISKRIAAQNPNYSGIIDSTGFPEGYGSTSQDVLIPAFLAAYSGQDALGVSLNSMPSIPLPNWRINYDGLMQVKFIKKRFKTFTLGHAYRSNYSVGSYVSSLDYEDNGTGWSSSINPNTGNYFSQFEIGQVTINEQFSPLVKIDMTWKNSLITKLEIKKNRMLNLSLANNQITETNGSEYVIGTGYRISDLTFKFRSGGRGKKISSDLDLKMDVNIRNNKTVIRKIVEDEEQITMGQQTISLKFSADYVVNSRLNLKMFYDKVITNPFISTSYPGAITNAGFSLRFTLAG